MIVHYSTHDRPLLSVNIYYRPQQSISAHLFTITVQLSSLTICMSGGTGWAVRVRLVFRTLESLSPISSSLSFSG